MNKVKMFHTIVLIATFSFANAQKYMIVGQKGGVTTLFPIENVDSVYFTGYETPPPAEILENPKVIGTYNTGKYNYEGFISDRNILYAYGDFGLRKIDITDKTNPTLISETDLGFPSLKARSAVMHGNNIYIAMRSLLGGAEESATPEIKINYESNIASFRTIASESICNNELLNKFFRNINIVSVDPASLDRVFVFKCYYNNGEYRNSILFRQKDGTYFRFIDQHYMTKAEATSALTETYTDVYGNTCDVDWNVIISEYNYFDNIIFNIISYGEFDGFIASENIDIDELGKGINTGVCSARMSTSLLKDKETSFLYKNIASIHNNGDLCFWLKIENLPNKVELPLLGLDNEPQLGLIADSLSETTVAIGIANNMVSNLYGGFEFLKGEWYNMKIQLTNNEISLYFRTKECGKWQKLLTTSLNIEFNQLLTGISASDPNIRVYMDDYYYNSTNIDEVSYINGKLIVVDKNDLSIRQVYNSDIKFTGTALNGNTLVVDGLKGFNVYDITNTEKPTLAYQHRTSNWFEYQGCDIFTIDGNVYAFLCNYYSGYSIIDITNPYNTKIICENDYSNLVCANKKAEHCFNFDVIVKYPYVYVTNAIFKDYLNTEYDNRGIAAMDITDFSDISPTIFPISQNDYYTNVNLGDLHPSRIASFGDYIFVNNSNKGIAVFNAKSPFLPQYIGCIQDGLLGNIHAINFTDDGYLIAGNGAGCPESNLYILKVFNYEKK